MAQLGQISHVVLWVTLATVTKKLRWMKLQTYKITFWQRLLARLSKKMIRECLMMYLFIINYGSIDPIQNNKTYDPM